MIEADSQCLARINSIKQFSFLEIDEEGTKASVATSVFSDISTAAVDILDAKPIILNRPFAFAIYDADSNEIIFTGKISEIEGVK